MMGFFCLTFAVSEWVLILEKWHKKEDTFVFPINHILWFPLNFFLHFLLPPSLIFTKMYYSFFAFFSFPKVEVETNPGDVTEPIVENSWTEQRWLGIRWLERYSLLISLFHIHTFSLFASFLYLFSAPAFSFFHIFCISFLFVVYFHSVAICSIWNSWTEELWLGSCWLERYSLLISLFHNTYFLFWFLF